MRRIGGLAVVLVVLAWGQAAHAQIITWNFSGTMDDTGEQFAGYLSFDSEPVPTEPIDLASLFLDPSVDGWGDHFGLTSPAALRLSTSTSTLGLQFRYGTITQLSADLFPSVIVVSIDIKPEDFPNEIELDEDDVEVAVLTTEDFDAATVDTSDLSQVKFGDVNLSARVSPWRFEFQDVDEDGDTDLVFEFGIEDTGALLAGSIEAELTAFTIDGTLIRGLDSVVIEDEDDDDDDDDDD